MLIKPDRSDILFLCVTLICLFAITACSGGSDKPVSLDADDQKNADERLYPQFDIAHAMPIQLAPELQQNVDQILTRVIDPVNELSDQHAYSLVVTAEPDADAGCLAGGRIFVSEGLLAWTRHPDELAAVLAVASEQCSMASQVWRQRAQIELAEFDPASLLMARYIDYRLNSNTALFNQLVTRGCGNADCINAASERLADAAISPEHLDRLAARIHRAWPKSVWLERIGIEHIKASDSDQDDLSWQQLIEPHAMKLKGLGSLAEARRMISAGNLTEAYKATRDARRAFGKTLETELMQAEVDLHNRHGFYSERIFEKLESTYGNLPHRNFYWGWAYAQANRGAHGLNELNESLSTLPKVTTHYYIGMLYLRRRMTEDALESLEKVVEAGEGHPYYVRSKAFIERERA